MNPNERINLSDMKILAEAFYNADNEGKEFLMKQDLRVALLELFGYRASRTELLKILELGDVLLNNEPIGISLLKFQEVIGERLRSGTSSTNEETHVRQTFLAFDSRCRNFLQMDDLERAFTRCAPLLLPSSSVSSNTGVGVGLLDQIFSEIDLDSDGRISYADFGVMMRS